jgi:phosphatidylserine decarboxylase
MRIHKEGRSYVALTTAIVLGAAAWAIWAPSAAAWSFLGLSVFFEAAILNFFRHPAVKINAGDEKILAPCDGKVVVVEKIPESRYFHDERWQVSIFMSPLDVHVNRVPVSGRVTKFEYSPGKYWVAWHPKSSSENEQTFTVVENERGKIGFKQIAGALARRIKWYVQEGDEVEQGAEFGFIKFGSRMDVFLPADAKIEVSLGQKTVAGVTVLGIWPS